MPDPYSSNPNDQLTPNKSIYDVSVGEIAFKNFVAGFSRGLGGIIVTVGWWLLLSYLFIALALPKLTPMFNQYLKLIEGLTSLTQTTKPGSAPNINPSQYQDLLKQFEKFNK